MHVTLQGQEEYYMLKKVFSDKRSLITLEVFLSQNKNVFQKAMHTCARKTRFLRISA